MRTAIVLLALVATPPAGGTGPVPPRPMPAMPLAEKVPVPGGGTYRLRFGAQLSVNVLCPVAKRPLSPRLRPTWVNGRPIGFC